MAFSIEVHVYDKRLGAGAAPNQHEVEIEVDQSTPLDRLIRGLSVPKGTMIKLQTVSIFCHGSPGFLQCCREGIHKGTVQRFVALKGKFDDAGVIALYACNQAALWTGRGQLTMDGYMLAARLARSCNAYVLAARDLQYYLPNTANFGKWEGPLRVFTPKADVVDIPVHMSEYGMIGLAGYLRLDWDLPREVVNRVLNLVTRPAPWSNA